VSEGEIEHVRPWFAISAAVLLGAAFVLAFSGFGHREPSHAGKPINQWLDNGFEDASMALHEVGPAAAPCIFDKLRNEHPRYGRWQKYGALRQKLPATFQVVLPRAKVVSFDELRACSALLEIGPGVIPALASGLNDASPAVRITCAWALALFCERGKDIGVALPNLVRASNDGNSEVRERAASALRIFRQTVAGNAGAAALVKPTPGTSATQSERKLSLAPLPLPHRPRLGTSY
jgi:hypothetical protein